MVAFSLNVSISTDMRNALLKVAYKEPSLEASSIENISKALG